MKRKLSLFFLMGILILRSVYALPNAQEDPRVQKIYDDLQRKIIWIEEGKWTSCGTTLLDTLAHVEDDGLWAEDYLPFVHYLQKANLSSPETQKEADALLTLAALTYVSDMKGERLDPHAVDKNIHIPRVVADETNLLRNYLSLPNHCGWIYDLAPSNPEYQRLKQLLALYRQKQVQGGWPQLPKDTKLQKGDKGPLVETLKAQLIAQDALLPQGQGSDVFDEALEDVIKTYQGFHALEQDGKVGGATLKALNTSVEDRIKSIIISLERQRWLPVPLPSRYIQVNIPGFYLKAVNGINSFYMPIITGREYRKTPVFYAPMTEIIFNPSWHVPTNIAVQDKLPKLKKNPNAFAGKGYHFYSSSGEEVSPTSVNWDSYSSGSFPIRIVQSPGNANALGKIRFTIDNPFSIYLHGTPEEKLFNKAKRSLSSGCIRVQDPIKLAKFVFDNPHEWTYERIEKESSGTQTKRVKLEAPLPVFVTYFTVFEDENHKWHFVDDEYGQDKKLWTALEKAKKSFTEEAIGHHGIFDALASP